MSTVSLPQELKTQKLKSLSGDLRDIAEELIAKKFDIKEEVVPKRDSSFPMGGLEDRKRHYDGQDTPASYRCPGPCCQSSYGSERRYGPSDRMESWVDFSTRREYFQYSTSDISVSGIRRLMYEFDKRNIRRDGRELRMGRNELRRLMTSDTGMMQYFVEGTEPMIMGMPIKLDYDGYGTMTIRGYRY